MSKRKQQIKEKQRHAWYEQKHRRKTIRHNTAVNQEKHRLDWQPLQPDAFGRVADQRVMPRDEQSRRAGLEWLSAQHYRGQVDEEVWQEMAAASPFQLGIVTAVGRGLCYVSSNEEALLCDIRGSLTAEGTGLTNIVATGDRVLVQPLGPGRGVVEEVLPRRSGLTRPDPFYSHLKQAIATNVDGLLILASWREPHLWLELIDEFLIAAERNSLEAVICVNKMDLAADPAAVHSLLAAYRDLRHPLLFTSAVTGEGLPALQVALARRTTVLAGLSGVGKSTLISALDPQLDLKTAAVSEARHEGRHTTTQATLLPLSFGGYVVDTPGIRGMGLAGLRPADLLDYYPDVAEAAAGCRFSDCLHSHEPGCAVKSAVASGQLAGWRLENYHKLYGKLAG